MLHLLGIVALIYVAVTIVDKLYAWERRVDEKLAHQRALRAERLERMRRELEDVRPFTAAEQRRMLGYRE